MSNHPQRTGHQIKRATFPPGAADSAIVCSCGFRLAAPTPELADSEWQAHRRGTGRSVQKAPGYVFGGAFK